MSSNPTNKETVIFSEMLIGGSHWSGVIRRGTTLRLTDLEGGANVSALFYNVEEKLERYNMADTLKGQHTACLSSGDVCYSDMGRVLCSITADTCGWHDTICGVSDAAMVEAKYGRLAYQQGLNEYYKNGYDSLINELGKYGMGKRDIVSNINFFSKVIVDDNGSMHFVEANSQADDYVDLRFEMDCLVVLSTCQHPLDPAPAYSPKPVDMTARYTGTAPANDACRLSCPENERAFINTERFYGLTVRAK
ncbi:urea amidolyase associated protein UAAP1 [Mariprofundus ferrooxydans]|uniref:urea amidolyase associated protein UAAP1 n=1 Tax=Mariprofundus ferrooxydans TaxID=314344 RepID=UPI00036E1E5C|nr:urea amidolyase associated protein UAAP1 [Mariprofundus ferrooxydans]